MRARFASSARAVARALSPLPLAALAFAAAPSPARAAPAGGGAPPPAVCPVPHAAAVHTDKDTGLEFPSRADGLVLVGTATRYKYGFAKVYAVGLYVGGGARAYAGGAAALDAVQNGALPAVISIRLARNVSAKDLGDALEASIAPQVRARGARDASDPAADLSKLAELGARLTAALGQTLPTGTEVAFRWLGAGDLRVTVNGGPLAVFENAPLLCGGFFATYVSDAPLIPAARAAWVAGIEKAQGGK